MAFIDEFTVSQTHCDASGVMRCDAYFTWFQLAAEKHCKQLGLDYGGIMPKNLAWILLDVRAWWTAGRARLGDQLTLHTHIEPCYYYMFPREYNAYNARGELVVHSDTTWAIINLDTRMLSRSGDIMKAHNSDDGDPREWTKCEPPAIIESPAPSEFSFSPIEGDIDINGHVNNARYIAWLCRDAGKAGYDITSVNAKYAKEVMLGDKLRSAFHTKDGAFYYTIKHDETMCFCASGTMAEVI